MYCTTCGAYFNDQSVICPNCGAKQQPAVIDNGGFGWGLLGFLIPLGGLLLFVFWMEKKPKTARAAGVGALTNVITQLVIGAVFFLVFFSTVASNF